MTVSFERFFAERSADRTALHLKHLNGNRVLAARRLGFEQDFVGGDDCWLIESDGGRVLDCDAGNAVFAVGRNAPRVRDAVRWLLERGPANWVTRHPPLLAGLLAEAIAALMPAGLDRILFTNTGAETVEAAMKLARRATGHSRFLCLDGDFHGLTFGALSVTDPRSRLALTAQGFGPMLPGCMGLPWGEIEGLSQELAKGDVAALLVEPVQGASVRVLHDDYLRQALRLCREHGALFIADEILSGLGRTGKFLACQHAGVTPDVVLLAKGLSGGVLPVGALVVRDTIWEALFRDKDAFIHASTFQENDYAMAAGLATLDIIETDGLVERAAQVGKTWIEKLRALQAHHPMIADVRGRGLLIGVELRAAGGWLRSPAARWLEQRGLLGHLVMMWLVRNHRVIVSAPTRNNLVRLHPPLTFGVEQAEHVANALDAVLTEAERFPDGAGRMLFERLREM